jgi:hypothetical protein
MCLFLIICAAGSPTLQYPNDQPIWEIPNPISFMPQNAWQYILPFWSSLLALLTVTSLVSVYIRYKRGTMVEREQLKWLLYACAIFALVYVPSVLTAGADNLKGNPLLQDLINVIFLLTMVLIPAVIAIAILRYRLFDIEVIIRLTLVYALVTGTLGLLYASSVILLQASFRAVTGQTSDIAVVLTTLIIAALFNPLRSRIQTAIDRRFFRPKYNTQQALAEFTVAARSSADLDALTGMMVDIVQKTFQPTQVTLQLKPRIHKAENRPTIE